jgi:hypothetical protein
MTHWLEEAEKKYQEIINPPKVDKKKIEKKRSEILENYKEYGEIYDGFIQQFFNLCQRANNLPPEARIPWGLIEAKSKENKLDNHLAWFASRYRFEKRVPTKTFPFIKTRHYKQVRKIMISVSRTRGMANIEVYENFLAKTRMKSNDESDHEDFLNDGFERIHNIYHHEINKLDRELALKLLDWLTFREETASLPFDESEMKH